MVIEQNNPQEDSEVIRVVTVDHVRAIYGTQEMRQYLQTLLTLV